MEEVPSLLSSASTINKKQVEELPSFQKTSLLNHNRIELNEDEEEALLDRLCGTDEDDNDNDHKSEESERNAEEEFVENNTFISSEGEDAKEYTKGFIKNVCSYNSESNDKEIPLTTIESAIIKRILLSTTNASLPSKTTVSSELSSSVSLSDKETECNKKNILNGRKRKRKRKHERKTYICDECHKSFGGNTDLKRHKLIHSNEKPFKCDQCGKSYRQAINLKNHITTAHAQKKQYSCEKCPKTFALKERLKLHMRLHSGEKPYVCNSCDKRFARGGQLHQHNLTHHSDGPKKYRCDKCLERFSSASNLKAHKQRHEHGPEHYCDICKLYFVNDVLLKTHLQKLHRKQTLECDICNETVESNDFANHMKEHVNDKRHICHLCNTMFVKKSQYNVHMKMHSGERPYQCRICSQTFAHSSVLKLHIRKHTGEKPFRCLLCSEDEVAFSQLAHLKTHMKKIHKQSKPYLCEGCHEFFKVKVELETHQYTCEPYLDSNSQNQNNNNPNTKNNNQSNLNGKTKLKFNNCLKKDGDLQILSDMRFHIAILLKKISTDQKLQQLGFEKRLIDNVVIASLKMAKRNVHTDSNLTPLVRMRRNVEELLNWIVPAELMENMRQENCAIETILEKIVTNYIKQK